MENNLKRITAVLGPTNTGKTHLAVDTLLSYESGILGFPLRLLAESINVDIQFYKNFSEKTLGIGDFDKLPWT